MKEKGACWFHHFRAGRRGSAQHEMGKRDETDIYNIIYFCSAQCRPFNKRPTMHRGVTGKGALWPLKCRR